MLYCKETVAGGGPCPCQMTQAKLEEKPSRLDAITDRCTNPQCRHLYSQHIAGVPAAPGDKKRKSTSDGGVEIKRAKKVGNTSASKQRESAGGDDLVALNPSTDVLHQFLKDTKVCNDKVNLLEKEYTDITKLQKGLPATVNKNFIAVIDLRLPHDSNPLLQGENHPLLLLCSVILAAIIKCIIVVGSSGCGKTSTAFLVAKKSFSLYMEVLGDQSPIYGHHILASDILSPGVNSAPATYDDVQRRVLREVVARALVLLCMKTSNSELTPYEWLLFCLSDQSLKAFELTRKELKGSMSLKDTILLLQAISKSINCEGGLRIIFDEMHVFDTYNPSLRFINSASNLKELTGLQSVVVAIGVISSEIAGAIYLGTQISLHKQISIASAVFKIECQTKVLVVGQYPFLLSGYGSDEKSETYDFLTVKGNLAKVFIDQYFTAEQLEKVCLLLQGRPRFFSTFVYLIIAEKKSFDDAIIAIMSNRSLIYEMARILGPLNKRITGENHLLAIWCAYARCCDGIECTVPLTASGTLAFTSNVKCTIDGRVKKNSVEIDNSTHRTIEFDHCIMEPLLIESIVRYLQDNSPDKPYYRKMYDYSKREMLKQNSNSIRGTLLDTVVLTKFVCDSYVTPIKLQTAFPGIPDVYHNYTFQLHRIVIGLNQLSSWMHLISTNPDADILPGLKARNAAVDAGADGVFAAFLGAKVVYVSFACTWGNAEVTREKVGDQILKSNLHDQFQKATGTGLLYKRKSVIDTALNERRSRTNKYLQVLVELPQRAKNMAYVTTSAKNSAVFIINKTNVCDILGFNCGK